MVGITLRVQYQISKSNKSKGSRKKGMQWITLSDVPEVWNYTVLKSLISDKLKTQFSISINKVRNGYGNLVHKH